MSASEPSPDHASPAVAGPAATPPSSADTAAGTSDRIQTLTPKRPRTAVLLPLLAAGMMLFALRLGPSPEARFGGQFVPPAFREASDFDAASPTEKASRGRNHSVHDGRRSAASVATASPLERFLQAASRDVRQVGQREQRRSVVAIDLAAFGVARDAEACAAPLRQLLRSPQLVEAQLVRLEALGRPAFLCAVAELATFDYDDPADCRIATRVHQVLGRFVGSNQLEVVSSGGPPSESETCRYLATANAWRQLAERFARDEASYRALRAEVGKASVGDAGAEGPR